MTQARLAGHGEFDRSDIRLLASAREDSVAYLTRQYNRRLVRAMLRASSHVRSKSFEARRSAVSSRLADPAGTAGASLRDAVGGRDLFERLEQLESFLDQLIREGWVIQLPDRGYVWVGE